MTDILKRRMEQSLDDAASLAEDLAEDKEITLPPSIVGQLGSQLFQARVQLLLSERIDFPENDGRGIQ